MNFSILEDGALRFLGVGLIWIRKFSLVNQMSIYVELSTEVNSQYCSIKEGTARAKLVEAM